VAVIHRFRLVPIGPGIDAGMIRAAAIDGKLEAKLS
jgi:hypothetical protein